MSRILLIGVGPLPAPERHRVHATGLRLGWFLRALQNAGVDIYIGELYFSGIKDDFVPLSGTGIVEHRLLGPEVAAIPAQLNAWMSKTVFDGVVALTDVGSVSVARSDYAGPLHVDYFGHPMAERSQQAAAHTSNASLHSQWLDVLPVLLRADRFSACSNAQRCALLGELGAAGRLNKDTTEYPFVEIIPPLLPSESPVANADPGYLEKHGIDRDARVILSTGGYNTWVDHETLFRGVEEALRRDERLHFVSTGGAIEGHVTLVYERFCELVENSPLRHRFHLLGWIPHGELTNVLLQSHVAVNVDKQTREGEFGCRNRLYEWLWAGLRVVSTVSSESTRRLVDQGHVREVVPDNWRELASALVEEAARGRAEDLAKVQVELRQEWSVEQHFHELTAWVKQPTRAPDRMDAAQVRNPLTDLQRAFLEHADIATRETEARRMLTEVADRLEGSRAFRLYMTTNPDMRKLIARIREMNADN